MRHVFNTFLSTSAPALFSLNAFSFHPGLQSLTRIRPSIIQRVPRRQFRSYEEDEWGFQLRNMRFGSRFNPNFYRIDAHLRSPPGSYHIANFNDKTAEALDIGSLVRAHVTPFSSIRDIAETLASDLLAKLPAVSGILLRFMPEIRSVYNIANIIAADCAYQNGSFPVRRRLDRPNELYVINTQWQLPMSLRSGHTVLLSLVTEECVASTVHDQISSLENSRFRPRFDRVHPTFGLHEQVASIATRALQIGSVEGAALYLARCLFHFADQQSPCKRIRRVVVLMRDMLPLSDSIRTDAARLHEFREREHDNSVFTFCFVPLDRRHYEQSQRELRSKDFQSGRHRAFLALGSNLGNRIEMIESAVRKMGDRGLSVTRTSALYETKPMYLENQELFLNGACEVCSTNTSYR